MAEQLLWCGLGTALCFGVRRRAWNARALGRGMAVFLCALIGLQMALVWLGGLNLMQSVLPLHLCSATALVAVPMLWKWEERLFQFCWFLGMPGAALALCIPVVGYSPWPALMRTVFLATHATLLFGPLLLRCGGVRPRRKAVWTVYLAGNGLMAAALAANHVFGANYMFLSYAPLGTPLAWMARYGLPCYLAWLEGLALLLLRGLSRVTARA